MEITAMEREPVRLPLNLHQVVQTRIPMARMIGRGAEKAGRNDLDTAGMVVAERVLLGGVHMAVEQYVKACLAQ